MQTLGGPGRGESSQVRELDEIRATASAVPFGETTTVTHVSDRDSQEDLIRPCRAKPAKRLKGFAFKSASTLVTHVYKRG